MMIVPKLKENLNREMILAMSDKYSTGNIQSHGKMVAGQALKIFDCMAGTTNLSASWRNLLEQAALIHDIGHCINEKDYDRHTHYLIMPHYTDAATTNRKQQYAKLTNNIHE